jgi:RNA polymerase sigma-70 factor (ECF subfamily)
MSEYRTRAAIEAVARDSYGRLIAYLAARSGDVAGAEDALGDAFAAALKRWPSAKTRSLVVARRAQPND